MTSLVSQDPHFNTLTTDQKQSMEETRRDLDIAIKALVASNEISDATFDIGDYDVIPATLTCTINSDHVSLNAIRGRAGKFEITSDGLEFLYTGEDGHDRYFLLCAENRADSQNNVQVGFESLSQSWQRFVSAAQSYYTAA